jgi:pimeloyl-ACP methyl ester carboxylesterase
MRELAGRDLSVSETTRQLGDVRVPPDRRLGEVRDFTSLRFSARCLQSVDPQVLDPLLAGRWLEGFPVEATFSRVGCPALILRGDEALGGMLSRAEADRLARLLRQGGLVDVPGAGHLIHWQASEATARLVLGFLESL